MNLLRQSIAGLSIAVLAVVLLWAVWLTGQAENQFARTGGVATDCTLPTGWGRVDVHPEDDVANPIEAAGYTLEEILVANCLPPDGNLPADDVVYLPADVIALLDPDCGPPQGWGYYTTQAGDSLSTLAEQFEVDIDDLLHANCFIDETDFEPGVRIYAPSASQEP
jgi:hypothetical protein